MTNLITIQARCAQCNEPMVILLGMGAPGMFHLQSMMQLEEQKVLHGSFQCGACGCYYCWNHCDGEKPCMKCGQKDWRERQYLDTEYVRKIAAPTNVMPSLKRPGITLLIGLLFYASVICGLITGQTALNPQYKIFWYVTNWLPAIVIFLAGRKLQLPILVAGILALIGPAIITWLL